MAEFLNKNIRYLRNIKGFSQQELADKIGIDRSTISRIENGEIETTIDNAIKIAKILSVGVSDLISIDLSQGENIQKTIFDKNGVKITIAHDSNLDDKTLLEVNNFLLKEKILKDELKKKDKK